jgi:outer membrane protein insertion porin family
VVNGVRVIYYRRIFKPKILPPNIYFHHGELYNQTNYLKTITRFGALNAWNVINIDTSRQANEDTMDFHIRLSPAKKYSFVTNFEGSRNQSAISGNLFGLAVNFGLQNRNFAKAANQANTNVRYGIEFGNNKGEQFIQTQQIVLSHNIYFPRALLLSGKLKEKANSVLSFNAASTDRRELYQLTSFNSAFGWDIQVKKGILSIRYPNIEFSNLNPRPTLDSIFLKNPSLKNIFTDGFVESILGGLTLSGGKKKNLHIFRFNGELSGILTPFIKKSKFLDTNLYRFIKVDGEYTNKITLAKSAIALRFFGGIGYEFNSTVNPLKKNNLPFFKQYFSGGPNSMRAWGLRRLGPGSAVKNFTDTNAIPERYGDVQLEANIEWRFPITKIAGVVLVNGALFTDIGNVWLLKSNAGPPEEVFNFSRLGKDLAVGAGAGLRIDFGFFVLRFDYAYKVKDPSPPPADAAVQNKWFGYKFFKGDQFQLGVRYPFIF